MIQAQRNAAFGEAREPLCNVKWPAQPARRGVWSVVVGPHY